MNKVVCDKGINDTYCGWMIESKINYIIYRKWYSMLHRVYSENNTYINSEICLEWHWLSKFAKDFKMIDGYNEEKLLNGELELDKDIKSNGKNKYYCLDNCMLISKSENSKQANKTRDYSNMNGENNHMYGKNYRDFMSEEDKISHDNKISNANKGCKNPRAKKVEQYDLNGNLIKTWDYIKQAEKKLNISGISACCKGKQYTAGGFKWKYALDGNERSLKNKGDK